MKAPSVPLRKAKTAHTTLTLDRQLERKLTALRKYRGAIHFYRTHRSLLSSGATHEHAESNLAYAERRVRQLSRTVRALRTKVQARDVRRLAALPPRKAICAVFADDCRAAVAVASCESHLQTTAQNGQYLGLFQMGSYERRLFGHGPTAHEQAVAAHRYFVRSGRDWSPWSCRWAAA
jgi:lysozyme-like protein